MCPRNSPPVSSPSIAVDLVENFWESLNWTIDAADCVRATCNDGAAGFFDVVSISSACESDMLSSYKNI